MKLGIQEIASYIPPGRVSNFSRMEQFGIDERFIADKLGIDQVSRKDDAMEASGLCTEAFSALEKKVEIDPATVDAVVVVTQNPDSNIPHVSARLHGLLGIKQECACFDISLGCSGFVHGLSLALSFMESNGLRRGLLFTADPYSKVVDQDDKNTAMIFGDGATATLLSDRPAYVPGKYSFGTVGAESSELSMRDGRLFMNGRAIFNFAAKKVGEDVATVLRINGLTAEAVDKFVFHQGSKYIVDTLRKRLGLPPSKVPFVIAEYGNTVSSSIPMVLESEIRDRENRLILVSGFGVGLAWASTVLRRTGN